jgi:site-specific DNA recombinase
MVKRSDLTAAIYARVSSAQQAEAGTIASQVQALKEKLQSEGLTLEEELCFVDEGYSGATLIRPALERLRDVAANGALERVYVHSPDRLARKYAYQVLLIEEFQRGGAEVVFLNHSVGQSAEDNLLLQVQGMMAEYERAKILERSRRGKLHRARQGSVNVLSGAPYGYRYVGVHEGGGEARYEIVVEEARVVRQVFEWMGRERLSIGEISRRLKRRSVPTRTGKSVWDRTTIWGMLKNPAYQGAAAFGKTRTGARQLPLRPLRGKSGSPKRPVSTRPVTPEEWISIPVPAIVSRRLFAAVQEQLVENRRRSRQGSRGARHLLQGLALCAQCGYAYYGKKVSFAAAKGKPRHYAYYRCIGTDAYRFGGQRICDNPQVRTDLLEAAVWEEVCFFLEHPERIEEEYRRRLTARKTGEVWERPEQIQALIQKVKRGIARLIDAYADGLIEQSEFDPRIRRAKERLVNLEAEWKERSNKEAEYGELQRAVGRIQEFAGKVKNGLRNADWKTRREIIRTLVKQVEVDEKNVRVVYRVNPHPFVKAPQGALCNIV